MRSKELIDEMKEIYNEFGISLLSNFRPSTLRILNILVEEIVRLRKQSTKFKIRNKL